ncbi:hypothetical protein AAC691_08895 [Nguyenibacter vanlangensis]|uniref:DUF2285 domain-containing protein n=1 Tax=Nguyenibacter vanlangensis TaxID=1216886 RepID=A0ABZ3D9R6_9PROT
MTRPKVDAGPADEFAPAGETLTDYDRLHLITYLMLLDAVRDGAPREACAREILRIDPDREPERARHAYDSHLARARWMTETGYHLLKDDPALKPF